MKAINLLAFPVLFYIFINEVQGQEIIKKNLSDSINTAYTETKPMISPDGEILYFARQNYPENFNGKYDDQDIYYSTYSYGGWTKAKNIGEPLNNEMPNGVASIYQSGKTLLLLNSYEKEKEQEGIALTHKTDSGWTMPEPIEIRDFHNHSEFVDYFLSANGHEMLIAVERDDSYGDQDLYVSTRQKDGSWSKPINLGPNINTKQPEFSPFLATDNKTLFFSSMGHEGFGNADVYYSKRLDSTWTNWSKPENLGSDVNTEGFEAYYTIPNDGTIGYYVSSEGGMDDSRDIFSITLPYKFRPEPVILMKGNLLFANEKIDTSEFSVNFLTNMSSESEIFVEYDGAEFDALLPTGGSYFFYTNKSGYISESHYIDLTDQKEYAEEAANIHLIPIKKGESFVSHNLQFEEQSAELTPSSYFELIRLLEVFQRNEGLQLEMTAHAFDFNDSALNDSIALQRVSFIQNFYMDQGLPKDKFIIKSAGSKTPAEEGYRQHLNSQFNINNRIGFKILETNWKPVLESQPVLADNNSDLKESILKETTSLDTTMSFYFDFDSYSLSADHEDSKQLLELLNQIDQDSIQVIGYTCDYGNKAYNEYLAQKRAETIQALILEKAQSSKPHIVTLAKAHVKSEPEKGENVIEARKKNRRVDVVIKPTYKNIQAIVD